ncbi:hypothetical protein HaLaN_18855, partial [Haematococcus lacustris]
MAKERSSVGGRPSRTMASGSSTRLLTMTQLQQGMIGSDADVAELTQDVLTTCGHNVRAATSASYRRYDDLELKDLEKKAERMKLPEANDIVHALVQQRFNDQEGS